MHARLSFASGAVPSSSAREHQQETVPHLGVLPAREVESHEALPGPPVRWRSAHRRRSVQRMQNHLLPSSLAPVELQLRCNSNPVHVAPHHCKFICSASSSSGAVARRTAQGFSARSQCSVLLAALRSTAAPKSAGWSGAGEYTRACGISALRLPECAMHPSQASNPSIERTSQRPLRALWPAAHVER